MEANSRIRRSLYVLSFVLTLIVAGCEGSGEGLDESGRPVGEGGSSGELQPTIESIQTNVFDPRCVRCHSGANANQNLRLDDAQTSYNNLVGVTSEQDPRFLRVEAGNSEDSYLIHKLEGNQSFGDQMPQGEEPLDQETIDVIRQWIDEGAAPPSDGGGNGDENGFEPTIEAIQANVFDDHCVNCHSGDTPAGPGLNLEDAQTSYDNLVGVPAVQNPTLFRVEENNPDDSYLIHKLEGTNNFGEQMPRDADPLPQDTIDIIRLWITQGAAPPEGGGSAATFPATASDEPPSIVTSWPEEGGWLAEDADWLLVGFDRELNPDSVHAGNIRLLHLDPAIGAQDVAFQWQLANPRTILVLAPLDAGDYRLELSGEGSEPLTGLNAVPIDGDRDGQPGGDFILEFFTEAAQ